MNKLVIITGASSGIGAATAKAFSAAGHPLLLIARRLEPMEALKLPNALCRAVDVLDSVGFKTAIDDAQAKFGPAEILVNNAGVMMNAPAAEGETAQWDAMIDINIKGVLTGIRLVINDMIARNSGTIVNIGSIAVIMLCIAVPSLPSTPSPKQSVRKSAAKMCALSPSPLAWWRPISSITPPMMPHAKGGGVMPNKSAVP